MEAASLFAAGQFRKIKLGVMLYVSDCVAENKWDKRIYVKPVRSQEEYFWAAADACFNIADL